MQQLVSQALESIPPNQIDQQYIPPPAPLVAPVSNENIHENDHTQLQMLYLVKSLQEELKMLKTNLTNTTTKNEPRKQKNVVKYCWSHVACTHSRWYLNHKRNVQKDEATVCYNMGVG